MNVLYTCDDNYVWLMGISTISLFENNSNIKDLEVYLLGQNISSKSKEILANIAEKYNRKITIIDVPKFNIPESLVSARWPLSAYTRLFSGLLLPKFIDRILYLDCDTIVKGDLSDLEQLDLHNYIAFAVKDCVSGMYKKNIGLNKAEPYFNAGVILFNLNELRKVDINEKIECYMKQYRKLINYADQDVLNGMFVDKIAKLPPEYNVMTIDVAHTYDDILTIRHPTEFYSREEISKAVHSPKIIHYTTNMLVIRPWYSNSDHPLKEDFIYYLNMSAWKNVKLNKMIFNGKTANTIKIIQKFPKKIGYKLLGIIHGELKPFYTKAIAGVTK